ncbi:MAG: translation initiation factor IF-2 associated domain-containing protein, partial [Alphaproteobacteria bacterium]
MSDKNEQKNETLKVKPGKLQLTKTVESGKVKQNFTHGRSKTVTVEVRKTRTFKTGTGGRLVEVKNTSGLKPKDAPNLAAPLDENLGHLTNDEREARMAVLKRAEEENKRRAEEERNRPRPADKRKEKNNDEDAIPVRDDGIVVAPEPVVEKPAKRAEGQTSQQQPQAPLHKHKIKDDLDSERDAGKPKGGKLRLKGD